MDFKKKALEIKEAIKRDMPWRVDRSPSDNFEDSNAATIIADALAAVANTGMIEGLGVTVEFVNPPEGGAKLRVEMFKGLTDLAKDNGATRLLVIFVKE